MPKQRLHLGRAWYAIHVVPGYEDFVKEAILKRAEAFDMRDKIFDAIVPKEKVWVIKEGKRELVEQKIYPGYVFIDMIVTDDSWFLVRNTPKVTGFVGTTTTPLPISPEEVQKIFSLIKKEEPEIETNFKPGDVVEITHGIFKGMKGKVIEVDVERQKLKVLVPLFNRETSVEVDFAQVKSS
jgi:transcriptional antiterminator NusG